MIEMIMSDGSTSAGLTAINWADKQEHLVPRINAEYNYRPKNNEAYPFGKNIFKAILPSKINTKVMKENYCIENSDLTLIFFTHSTESNKMSKILQNKCIMLNRTFNIIDLDTYDFYNIGIVVNLINENNYKIINITGESLLTNHQKQLLKEFLDIIYNMLKKENHDYSRYIAYNRD